MSNNLNTKFYDTLNDLINEIKELNLHNISEIILESTDTYLNNKNIIDEYYNNCNNLGKDFQEKNAIIFTNNNNIITGINLYKLWNSHNNEANKNNIWKYLFTLYLYAYCNIKNINVGILIKKIKSMDPVNIEDEFKTIYSVIDSLNSEKRINKLTKIENKTINTRPNPILDNLSNLNLSDNLINGEIGKLAKEIASEINPENFEKELQNKNPQELLNSLFTGNLNKDSSIMNLVNTISGKIQAKISSGSINENTLFNEAQGILGNSHKKNTKKKNNLNKRKQKVKNKIKMRQSLDK